MYLYKKFFFLIMCCGWSCGYGMVMVVVMGLLFLLTSTMCECLFFFFKDTPPPEISTLSLHDALPIWFARQPRRRGRSHLRPPTAAPPDPRRPRKRRARRRAGGWRPSRRARRSPAPRGRGKGSRKIGRAHV